MSSKVASLQQAQTAKLQAAEEQAKTLGLCRRLESNYDFGEWKKILEKHRLVAAEASIADSLRPDSKKQADLGDLKYWRGYADALHFAMTATQKVIESGDPTPEPKEDK